MMGKMEERNRRRAKSDWNPYYNVFSLVASYLAYQSGLDLGFSDRLTKRIFEFLRLG